MPDEGQDLIGRFAPYVAVPLALLLASLVTWISRRRAKARIAKRARRGARESRASGIIEVTEGSFFCPDCGEPVVSGDESCRRCRLAFVEDTEIGARIHPVKTLEGPEFVGGIYLTPRGVYFLCEAFVVLHRREDEATAVAMLEAGSMAAVLGIGVGLASNVAARLRPSVSRGLSERARHLCLDERVALMRHSRYWPAATVRSVTIPKLGHLEIRSRAEVFAFRTVKIPPARLESIVDRIWP